MNPLAVVGLVLAILLFMAKTSYELVLLIKKQTKGSGSPSVYCNYPTNGACVWAGPDSAKVRTYELADHLNASIRPELVRQSSLLEDILDALRTRHN